jgi:hypothetical protein
MGCTYSEKGKRIKTLVLVRPELFPVRGMEPENLLGNLRLDC